MLNKHIVVSHKLFVLGESTYKSFLIYWVFIMNSSQHSELHVQLYTLQTIKIEYQTVGDTWWQPLLSYGK